MSGPVPLSIPSPGRAEQGAAGRWSILALRVSGWSIAVVSIGLASLIAVSRTSHHEIATHPRGTADSIAAVLCAAAVVALLLRRRHPLLVLGAEVASIAVIELDGDPVLGVIVRFITAVALYEVVTRAPSRRGVAAASLTGVIVAITDLAGRGVAGAAVSDLVLIAAVTATSSYVRSQRELIASYRDRAEQAEREQNWNSDQAVAAERIRIARELHDVVAHHVSLLVVQAGAVRSTLPVDHITAPVLESMIDGGRIAMDELREMLDALRVDVLAPNAAPPIGASRSPHPDTAQIAELVEGARCAGLDVELVVEGTPLALPPSTSLAAYRIVQESLTNVVKHAPRSATRVALSHGPTSLEVTVVNLAATLAGLPSWPGTTPRNDGHQGHGVTGMRERVALVHGILEVGPCPGGWAVRAVMPVATEGRHWSRVGR